MAESSPPGGRRRFGSKDLGGVPRMIELVDKACTLAESYRIDPRGMTDISREGFR